MAPPAQTKEVAAAEAQVLTLTAAGGDHSC